MCSTHSLLPSHVTHCTPVGSNHQPSVSYTDALSNCARGARNCLISKNPLDWQAFAKLRTREVGRVRQNRMQKLTPDGGNWRFYSGDFDDSTKESRSFDGMDGMSRRDASGRSRLVDPVKTPRGWRKRERPVFMAQGQSAAPARAACQKPSWAQRPAGLDMSSFSPKKDAFSPANRVLGGISIGRSSDGVPARGPCWRSGLDVMPSPRCQ